jgi:transcriptional regulator with XRE-family HTH domain
MVGRQGHSVAEWAKCIAALRKDLAMTQTELADRLGVTAMTVSRWERGLVEPTASGYIGLGNLAGLKNAWYFWRRAGLDESQVRRTLAQVAKGNSRPKARAKGLGI